MLMQKIIIIVITQFLRRSIIFLQRLIVWDYLKKTKIVLDKDEQKIVSINNHNNNFLTDPPTFKLEFNNLYTYGFFNAHKFFGCMDLLFHPLNIKTY